MSYDFTAAVAAAKQAIEQGNSGTANYKYPLVYPQKGSSVVIRPLYNPASGQILRLFYRHEKTPCYLTYNQECPICKMHEDIKGLTGQDLYNRKPRGICFAQYISSTIPISKGEGKGNLVSGEIILFMFPKTVYTAMNEQIQIISQNPTGMDQAFAHPEDGLYLQISVDNNFQYSTNVVPYSKYPLMNSDGTQMTDEQFMAFLDSIEDLYEQVLPKEITEETAKQVQEYCDELYKSYVAPSTPQVGVPQGTAPQSFANVAQQTPVPPQAPPQVNNTIPQAVPGAPVINNTVPPAPPVAPPVQPTTVVDTPPWQAPAPPVGPTATNQAPAVQPVTTAASNTNRPQCFGCYNGINPQCICCPEDLVCKEATPAAQ